MKILQTWLLLLNYTCNYSLKLIFINFHGFIIQKHEELQRAQATFIINESSLGDDDHTNKATTNMAKMAKIVKLSNQQKKYNSQSEESSLSEEDSSEQQKQMPRDKIKPKKLSSDSQSQSQNSIDHIEERIKRLEQDLQHRIDRHKKQSQTKLPSSNKIDPQKQQKMIKNVASPPLPKKVQASKPAFFKQQTPQFQTYNPKQLHQKHQKQSNHKQEQKYYEKHPLEEVQKNTQKKSPKQNKIKKIIPEDKPQPQKKRNQHKSNGQSSINLGQLNKANKQIEDLMVVVEQLKAQNKQLREELSGKKKKPLAELQRLKQMKQLSGSTDAKLQKELQLLKIIESLQAKLKKSINKKIGKNRIGSSSSALLHKGIPTTSLN